MFLRYFQESGIVLRAAEQAGIARSTLYRWRDEDPRFRARWDSLAEQRRQQLEDTLMEISTDGERVPVFYKGVQVGWQQKNRLRATIALLAHLDRREKRQLAAGAKAELRESVSRSGVSRSGVSRSGVSRSGVSRSVVSPSEVSRSKVSHSKVSHDAPARPKLDKPVLVSHSGGRPAAEKPVPSKTWAGAGTRKNSVPPSVPFRLQDDWKLPLAARRPTVPPGPFRPAALAAAAVAAAVSHQPALRPFM